MTMQIENARFADPEQTIILADIDGVALHIPVDTANRHYRSILDENITIAAYSAPGPEEVRDRLTLTFAQLLIGLVAEEWITEEEGEAWLIGILPAAVLTLISGLPEGQRFAAKTRASRPSVVLRLDPLVVALAIMQEKTPEQLDTFFLTYANV
jgi:hypothetical protein